jgi:non-specific serine/threonine protein kinase/serine/threonine-protein kinase
MNLDAEQSLFDACRDADPATREQLLAACADAALAARVRRLLAAHDGGAASIEKGVAPPSPLAMPRQIGPYRVLERIGEGAMGEVYLAEQQEPVRRRVALKVLKFGVGTREVIARFELERQALATLAHPNIARILDAGATGDGRPYFAMEHVAGIPITRYCDDRGLPRAERLALFGQVCAGVQHAHLRGIIHRDLKPSNILVAEIDGHPAARIIDFGIAKATTAAGGDAEAHTRIGHLLGTPEYMSPEQAQLSPLDVDARTDVYSLGIVLYELLTGARPYAVTRDAVTPEAIAREIAVGEPVKPSARDATLRGDLEWIVLKSIEKDRNRRYSSPQELAADLERHARNEPVLAGPPSWTYRTGRFVRRHRLAVSAAAGLFIAALVFGSGMAWLARENARERDRANAEAEIARRVTAFTAGLFELASPEASGKSETTARELLDSGVRRLEAELARERPETRAALLEAAANAYRGIGELQESSRLIGEAIALRRERAAEDPAAYAGVLLREAALRRDQGNYDAAAEIGREAVATLAKAIAAGDDSLEDARTDAELELAEILRLGSRLEEAAPLAGQALSRVEADSPRSATHVTALFMVGRIHAARGEVAQAEPLLRHALALQVDLEGESSEDTVDARNGLAELLVVAGKTDEAETLLRANVEATRRIYGDRHAMHGITWNNLGNALSDIPEKFGDAEQAYLRAIDILSASLGVAHPEIATTYHNLGALYLKTHEWQKSADVHRKALDLRTALIGPDHPNTTSSRMGLALALNKLGKQAEAEALMRQAQAAFARSLGPDHWRTANAQYYLGVVLEAEGKRAEALREVRDAHARLVAALGADHPRAQAAAGTLAELMAAGPGA